MNILFLTTRLPHPPWRGDRLLCYHVLRALAQRHDVTLVSFTDERDRPESIDVLRSLAAGIHLQRLSRLRSWLQAWLGVFSHLPSQVSYYRSPAMARRIQRLCAENAFDAIIVFMLRGAPFVRHIPHPAKILLLGDSFGLLMGRASIHQPWWRRPGFEWERRRVVAFEESVTRDFRETWVLSPVDLEDLQRRGCPNLGLVTIGVDERLFDLPIRARTGTRLTFLGNLSVPHNIDAAIVLARRILPLVRKVFPAATLELAGADPTRVVRSLARIAGVTVTGPLPDLVGLWERSTLMIAPLRFSGGVQNKVLESMAAGVPTIATACVAQGVRGRDRETLIVADSEDSIAQAVVDLLRRPGDYVEMSRLARDHVRAHFSWDSVVDRLEVLLHGTPDPTHAAKD
ncbi:MAG TPA: glycosyltransferase family 4 protein [Candidatus Limnocylindria bacterium]|nr:glycosyltransferase family 4 protein [Candidatus Limnocylindria bacterium]